MRILSEREVKLVAGGWDTSGWDTTVTVTGRYLYPDYDPSWYEPYEDYGGGGYSGGGDTGEGDPIQWTDPQQPTENTCANAAISINVSGNTVTITGNIRFEGAGAGEHTNDRLLAALNSTWSGTFGQYTVITNMTIGDGGVVANVSGSQTGQPFTDRLGGSYIQTFTLNGASPERAEFTMDSFAHEFGHVLGLMDLYDWRTGERASGYSNNIMGNSAAPPTWENIRDLLAKKAAGCGSGS